LKQCEFCSVAGQSAHDLHPSRAGADDRNALAPQGNVMIPAGGMEHRTTEVVQAGDLRIPRVMAGFPVAEIRKSAS